MVMDEAEAAFKEGVRLGIRLMAEVYGIIRENRRKKPGFILWQMPKVIAGFFFCDSLPLLLLRLIHPFQKA